MDIDTLSALLFFVSGLLSSLYFRRPFSNRNRLQSLFRTTSPSRLRLTLKEYELGPSLGGGPSSADGRRFESDYLHRKRSSSCVGDLFRADTCAYPPPLRGCPRGGDWGKTLRLPPSAFGLRNSLSLSSAFCFGSVLSSVSEISVLLGINLPRNLLSMRRNVADPCSVIRGRPR